MDILCAFHAKDKQTCEWVLQKYEHNHDTNNMSVVAWINACKEYLKSLSDGPDQVSTG